MAPLVSREAIFVLFLSVWGLVVRKLCFRLNPGVRFSVDLVGESGDGVYRSLISVRMSHVCKTGCGIRCGSLRQLRALRVRAGFRPGV